LGKKWAIIGQKIKRKKAMPEIFTIKASDLVLKVSENIDPAKFDISKYRGENFSVKRG